MSITLTTAMVGAVAGIFDAVTMVGGFVFSVIGVALMCVAVMA